MRIIFEADSIASERMSGIGHTTLEILKELDNSQQSKHKIFVIVPWGKKKYVQETHRFKKIHIRQLPPGYKYINYLLTRTPLPIPVELVYGFGVYVFLNYKNWPLFLSKSITFVHDIAYLVEPDTTHPKNLVYLKKNMPRWLKRTNKIISISEQSRKEFMRFFPEHSEKVEVIYLGVNPNVFNPSTASGDNRILKEIGLDEDYFLMVGNIEPRKNILRTVNAFKDYVDEKGNVKILCIIGGDGWRNRKIFDRILELQNSGYRIVRPDKYVNDQDLPQIYIKSKGLIHTAIHEGFGLPPVQALACGVPVLASLIPTFEETLKNEKAVVFVDPMSGSAIKEGMFELELLQHNKTPINQYTWSKTASKLSSVINEVIS